MVKGSGTVDVEGQCLFHIEGVGTLLLIGAVWLWIEHRQENVLVDTEVGNNLWKKCWVRAKLHHGFEEDCVWRL